MKFFSQGRKIDSELIEEPVDKREGVSKHFARYLTCVTSPLDRETSR